MLFMIALLSANKAVLAVDATSPSITPTPVSDKQKQIDDLKERLATKVAELRQTQRRALFGTVKSTSVSTVTVETNTKDVKIELTDDIKVFQIIKGVRTTLTTDNLDKGDAVVVFGEYDTTLDFLKGKVIFIQNVLHERTSGTVSDVNKTDFAIAIQTPEGRSIIVDIEKATKILLRGADNTATKGGFSKITIGDTVHIVGTPVLKKDNRISGLRILDLGNLSGSTPAITETPKATPTPTKKSSVKSSPTSTPSQ